MIKEIALNQFIFETDQDRINGSPKNSTMKIKVAGKVNFEDSMYDLPTKILEIRFDDEGVPKIE